MNITKKSIIYNNDFYKLYRLANIYNSQIKRYYNISNSLDNLFTDILTNYDISYRDIINLRISDYKKFKRIKSRIEKMNIDKIYFCTWTISDNYMSLNHRRILKNLYSGYNYVINVDFGKSTNRKHYHGIIESDLEPIKWKYGFCKFVKVNPKDASSLAKYINKFSNHAIKDSTLSEERILYSRKKSAL